MAKTKLMRPPLSIEDFVLLNSSVGGGGATWLLRDDFTDTRAAGAVNGTAATPGPGTRAILDTGSNITVNGADVVIANGTSTWGQTVYALDAVTRTSGRMLFIENRLGASTTICRAGFHSVLAAVPSQECFTYTVSAQLQISDSGTLITIGSYAAATSYVGAIVLRAAGAYFFITGGSYTNWTLLWQASVNAVTPFFPLLSSYNAAINSSFVRIPDELWLPTPLAYDTFTRANGALGNSETSGPDSQITPARAWTADVGTWAVASNVAVCSALAGGIGIATVDTSTVNAITSATLTRAGNEVGVILRYADADNYVRAIHDGTNCKLIKRVATVETDVISAAVALGAGAIQVIPDGTSFSLYLNNAKVGSTSTISDAALQTGTAQGMFSTNTGNTLNDFSVFPRGSNGEYTKLNRWS